MGVFACDDCKAILRLNNAISPMCPGCGKPMDDCADRREPRVWMGGPRPRKAARGDIWLETESDSCVNAWMLVESDLTGINGWDFVARIPFHNGAAKLANEMERERQ